MTFETNIRASDLVVDERLGEYITKKISKLDRYIRGIQEAQVDLAYGKTAKNAKDRNVVQITLRGKGFILRAEERADDIYSAFDISIDKIQRRIEKYKGKLYRGRGDGTTIRDLDGLDMPPPDEEEADNYVIKRRKRFQLKPMSEMEAIEQMNMLGHENFFVFYNADTDLVNVLYRRRDNSYGLIETEIG
ncbi:MAG: ribosome-associated translation inhibitor RaiA [Anaerolineae bacterium]|nr:ribosome-associated translation inhibitor RaiA [Anaerolineae bacterium]